MNTIEIKYGKLGNDEIGELNEALAHLHALEAKGHIAIYGHKEVPVPFPQAFHNTAYHLYSHMLIGRGFTVKELSDSSNFTIQAVYKGLYALIAAGVVNTSLMKGYTGKGKTPLIYSLKMHDPLEYDPSLGTETGDAVDPEAPSRVMRPGSRLLTEEERAILAALEAKPEVLVALKTEPEPVVEEEPEQVGPIYKKVLRRIHRPKMIGSPVAPQPEPEPVPEVELAMAASKLLPSGRPRRRFAM